MPVFLMIPECEITADFHELKKFKMKSKNLPDALDHVAKLDNLSLNVPSKVPTKDQKPSTETLNTPCKRKKKTSKKVNEIKNHKVTDYFPIRRSNRKPVCALLEEKHKILEDAILSGKEDGFAIKEFPGKGRGVVTTKTIKRGEFVLEYYGDLINMEEAKIREQLYSEKETIGCYMYYFKHKDKQYCIDATKESGRLGRLVNHSKKGNLKTLTFFIDGTPHLILIASRDIPVGEELLYDYGDRSKMSLELYPWLAS